MAAFTKRFVCLLIYRQTISSPCRIPGFVDPKSVVELCGEKGDSGSCICEP